MKIAIIGGAGKMGAWLADFLVRDGRQVILSGRDRAKLAAIGDRLPAAIMSNVEAARAADIIVLSVPINSLEPVLQEIGPHLHPGQLVADITSVKTRAVELMHRYVRGAGILGTHPLFGPGATGLAGQNIVLTPTSLDEKASARRAAAYLESKGAAVTVMTPEEHDEIMSAVLGLTHFIGLVAADTLATTGKLKQMLEVGGTSFRLLMTLAESVLSEDPAFYASLQMNLPVTRIESQLIDAARQWAQLISDRNTGAFVDRMSRVRARFQGADPAFKEAYRRMYRVHEALRPPPTDGA